MDTTTHDFHDLPHPANGAALPADPSSPPPQSTALVRRSPLEQVRELTQYLADLDAIAKALCQATILPRDMQAPANLKLVLLQGLAMGFDPIQAIRASYIITSKDQPPRVGYYVEALVALVRTSPKCRFFRVEIATAEKCRIVCARRDEDESVVHVFEMTIEQARAANLDKKWERDASGKMQPQEKYTWRASPADMLRNRICGRAVKSVFQDVVFGMATPDELDDIATAEALESAGRTSFVSAPVASTRSEPVVVPAGAAADPARADVIDAELVEEGSGDPGWDELLDLIGKLAGVDTAGWLPPELIAEWDRRIGVAKTRAQLNAFAPWIGEAKKRAGKSRNCSELAVHMTTTFNEVAAKLKQAEAAAKAAAAGSGS